MLEREGPMHLRLFHVDAFASEVFSGNPAAVVPLDAWLPDRVLQAIAAENNLAETAFLVGSGDGDAFHLRWFTPAVEIDLCGHATLAAAHVLWRHDRHPAERLRFHTRSGWLSVARDGDRLVLDFPARPPRRVPDDAGRKAAVDEALGGKAEELWESRDLMVVLAGEREVRALRPDMGRVAGLHPHAVIVTAAGEEADFVSRFFAPRVGVPEDPVTGSSHCTLVPYWAERLGRSALFARQVSSRGGELWCTLAPGGERVLMAGHAVTYLEGVIEA